MPKTIKKGCYLCDLTTVSIQLLPHVETAEESHGFHYLTSLVSEGVDNASKGMLSIFVVGNKGDHEKCLPVYACIVKVNIYTGNKFSAIAAKLFTTLLWFVHAAAIGDALILSAKSGIELLTLDKVILHSCGNSWVASHDLASIYDGSYDPSFSIRLCCKDLRFINELAAQLDVPIEMGLWLSRFLEEQAMSMAKMGQSYP